jgi:hypothetical protein
MTGRLELLVCSSRNSELQGLPDRLTVLLWVNLISYLSGGLMKTVSLIGVLLLVLGVLAFVVPIPRHENHGVKIGDTKIGVQTESTEKLPPAVGIVLLSGGVLALVLGSRKG